MKASKPLTVTLTAAALFTLVLAIIVATLPKGFEHMGDMALSATGVALSRSYYAPDLAKNTDKPGYIYNGDYHVYANWPALGFKAIAGWYQLLGEDSIYNARLLTAVLYALSALLFFILLLRCNIDLQIASLSTLLFAVLPYHLEFGKMIFADMWLLPFWLLCFVIYTFESKYHWLILPIAVFASLAFMWFAVFVVPALCVIYGYHRYKLSTVQIGWLLLLSVALIWIVQQLLISTFSDVKLLLELKQWSVFSLFTDYKTTLTKLIRTSTRLLYESLVVILLGCWVLYSQGAALWQSMTANKALANTLTLVGLTLLFAVFFFPSWFLTHSFGTAFFSVFIAAMAAAILQASKIRQPQTTVWFGGAAIVGAFALFLTYPQVSNSYSAEAVKINQITAYIQQTNRHRETRPNMVFNLRNIRSWETYHALTLGIKEQTRGYIFSNRGLSVAADLTGYFQQQTQKLKRLRQDFNPHQLYFITDQITRIDDPDLANLSITGTLHIDDWHLYEIEL